MATNKVKLDCKEILKVKKTWKTVIDNRISWEQERPSSSTKPLLKFLWINFGLNTVGFTDISGSLFPGGDFRGTSLTNYVLNKVDFTCADLSGANLAGCELRGAILIGANLSKTNFTGANLSGAFLWGANRKDALGLPVDICTIALCD